MNWHQAGAFLSGIDTAFRSLLLLLLLLLLPVAAGTAIEHCRLKFSCPARVNADVREHISEQSQNNLATFLWTKVRQDSTFCVHSSRLEMQPPVAATGDDFHWISTVLSLPPPRPPPADEEWLAVIVLLLVAIMSLIRGGREPPPTSLAVGWFLLPTTLVATSDHEMPAAQQP